jgi:CheY-like chemotaxis protein
MDGGDPSARANGGGRLDPVALERLARQGGDDLLGALLESFRDRTPARLAEARAALAEGRRADVERVFHSLKSSAGLVGATRIQDVAREAESAAREDRLAEVERCALAIEAAFRDLLPDLVALRAEARPDPGPRPHPRIALVEDNEDNRLLTRVLLGRRYAVEEYANGAAAVAGIRTSPPALVLLDISLPGMDGLAVLKEIRAAPELAGLPVIALTAHAMRGDRERLLAAGFDDYVSKPIVDEEDLLRRIERRLEARR